MEEATNSGIDLSRVSFALTARENTKMKQTSEGSRPIFISLSQYFARYQKLKNEIFSGAGRSLAGMFCGHGAGFPLPPLTIRSIPLLARHNTQANRYLRDNGQNKEILYREHFLRPGS